MNRLNQSFLKGCYCPVWGQGILDGKPLRSGSRLDVHKRTGTLSIWRLGDGIEGLAQIGDQVLHIFDADRVAHEPIAVASGTAVRRRSGLERLAQAFTWHLAQLPLDSKAGPSALWQWPQEVFAASAGLCMPALKSKGAFSCLNRAS